MKKSIIKIDNIAPKGVVAIRLTDGTTVIRTQRQFILDLRNSGHIGDTGEDISDSTVITRMMNKITVREAIRNLNGGSVEGDFKFHKAGEQYLATENSKAVLESTAKVGESLAYEKDGYRIEGFLNVQYSARVEQTRSNAMILAELMSEMLGGVTQSTPEFEGGEFEGGEFEPKPIPARTPAKATTKSNGANKAKANQVPQVAGN